MLSWTALLFLNFLFGNNFRLTRKLQKQYREYLKTAQPDTPAVNNLRNHSTITETRKVH